MPELLVDFTTSLDGYGAAEGWPGWWGLEGPEYLEWLGEQPEADYLVLMGATTYRVMSGLAGGVWILAKRLPEPEVRCRGAMAGSTRTRRFASQFLAAAKASEVQTRMRPRGTLTSRTLEDQASTGPAQEAEVTDRCRYWIRLRPDEHAAPFEVFREREGASVVEYRSVFGSQWAESDIGKGYNKVFGPDCSHLEYDNEQSLRVHDGTGMADVVEGILRRGGAFVEVSEADALTLIATWDAPAGATEIPPAVTMLELWNRFRAAHLPG